MGTGLRSALARRAGCRCAGEAAPDRCDDLRGARRAAMPQGTTPAAPAVLGLIASIVHCRGRAIVIVLAAASASLLGSAAAILFLAPAASASGATLTMFTTVGESTFTVPAGVSYLTVAATGAEGGGGTSAVCQAGRGALATGTLPVIAGEVLYVEVGGAGGDSQINAHPAGGANGGGAGGTDNQSHAAGGGGGASDVRTLAASAPLAPTDSRLLVAGGGGGGGDYTGGCSGGSAGPNPDAGWSTGSAGGGAPGGGGAGGAAGASNTNGSSGCSGSLAGTLGAGGAGAGGAGSCVRAGGGGGSGYYGGGGGGVFGAGGGAGSSFIEPVGDRHVDRHRGSGAERRKHRAERSGADQLHRRGPLQHRATSDQRHEHRREAVDREHRHLERQLSNVYLPVAGLRQLGSQLQRNQRRGVQQLHARRGRCRPHPRGRRDRHQHGRVELFDLARDRDRAGTSQPNPAGSSEHRGPEPRCDDPDHQRAGMSTSDRPAERNDTRSDHAWADPGARSPDAAALQRPQLPHRQLLPLRWVGNPRRLRIREAARHKLARKGQRQDRARTHRQPVLHAPWRPARHTPVDRSPPAEARQSDPLGRERLVRHPRPHQQQRAEDPPRRRLEIGIANKQLTTDRATQQRLLRNF